MKLNRLAQQIKLDWKLASRHQILVTAILLGLFLSAVLRIFFPSQERLIETSLGLMVVVSTTAIFLGASLFWIPRLSGVWTALEVTPVRPLELLLSKGSIFLGLYGLFGALVLLASLGFVQINPGLFPGLLSLAWTQGYLGYWLALRQKTISGFMAQALGWVFLFQIPVLALVLGWSQKIWHLFPGYGSVAWVVGQAELVDFLVMFFWATFPFYLCLNRLRKRRCADE